MYTRQPLCIPSHIPTHLVWIFYARLIWGEELRGKKIKLPRLDRRVVSKQKLRHKMSLKKKFPRNKNTRCCTFSPQSSLRCFLSRKCWSILGFALGDVGSSLKVLGREETRCDIKCLFKCHFLCETLTALIRTPNLSLPGHFLFLFSDFFFLVKTYEHLSYMFT